MKFIEDKELQNLYREDLLETKKYADTLKNIVKKSKTPLTIGIFGEWGSGKSSVINTVKNNINKNKIKFIIYDAWKYQGDSFRRMFLRELANQLDIKMQDNFESFYVDKNETVQINKKINWAFFIASIVIIILAFISLFVWIPDNIKIEWKIGIPLFISIIGISIGISRNLFDAYKININKTKFFAPEQFEEIYHEIIDSVFKPNFNPIKWVKEKIKGKIEKIVIVIDNLDRCDDNTIYELLTTIKTFLQKENIIFIIPIDDLKLKKFLAENHKLNEKEVDEFLRKIFDVTLKIKQFKPLDMFHYTNKLNKKYQLNLKPDTIDIFAKEYATNPRRIIQLINNLLVEKNLLKNKYNENFVDKYENLIAKLLIIREEWPNFYKKLCENPNLINNYNNKNEELKNFLKRTKGYSVNVNLNIIEKIISNIDNDFEIDNLLIKNLNNHYYDEIQKEQIDENLFNFIFNELKKEIENQTFKGGALNRFKNLIKLNSIKKLPLNFIKRFNSDFEVEEILQIIENLSREDFDDLFEFIDLLHKNNFDDLLNKIVNQYKEIWDKKPEKEKIENLPEIWNDGLDYLINNIENKNILKSLQKAFINFYDYYSEAPLYKEKWIEENKLKDILSQEFIDYLIEKVDEKFENDAFKELIFFAEKNLISIKETEKVFGKLNWCKEDNFQNQNEAQEKCISDLIYKIQNLNRLLENLNPIEYESQIIINKLNSIQKITKKIKRQTYNNYFDNKEINLIDNLAQNQANELLKFYLNIYKDTYNNTNVLDYIRKLVNKYQELKEMLYSNLIAISNKYNFTLKPFADYLLSQKEFNKNLLEIYLNYIKNEEILERYNQEIKDKIIELLKQFDKKIEWFFNKIDKKILKNGLTKLLEEDFESFEKLPVKLKKLTFDYICNNDLIKNFENDIEILKELMKSEYFNCIEDILVKKLGDKNIDEVIEILETLEEIPMELWKKLALLEKYKKQEEYKIKISNLEKKVKSV